MNIKVKGLMDIVCNEFALQVKVNKDAPCWPPTITATLTDDMGNTVEEDVTIDIEQEEVVMNLHGVNRKLLEVENED